MGVAHRRVGYAIASTALFMTGSTTVARVAMATSPPMGPQTVEVGVDSASGDDAFVGAYIHYFPDKVTVHPGDTVLYKSTFTGEPHSVSFGRDIQAVIEAYRALPPEVQSGQAPPAPELMALAAKIPALIPDGPGDALQNSVNPCFVATGEIPSDSAAQCPVTTAPGPFDGTATFWNSGFMADGDTFELKLADNIAPGTYLGYCTLHTFGMITEVDVVAADQPVDSAADVAAAAKQQLADINAKIAPAVADALANPQPGKVMAGVGPPDAPGFASNFIPADASVKAGEPMTWTISGPHTISFNAPESARTILAKGPDGGYHLNPESLAPAGFAPPEGPPPTGDAPPPPTDVGKWDGTGFLNSGIMFGGDFVVTFTTPGSYAYVCLIHPDMKGTVTVT